jgi:hypothetical protein
MEKVNYKWYSPKEKMPKGRNVTKGWTWDFVNA